jgi:hypothetical protein|nr:FHA domain-containing protein [Kofleriaceae bacterium]
MKTIGVSLWDGQLRGAGVNAPTIYRSAVRPPIFSARDLFVDAYPRFADKCRAFDEPGLAIVAVDATTGRAAGLVRLSARVGRPVTAIVGRHDHCDLFLDNDARLPLRQLAVVLAPVKSWERGRPEIHYRVFDLRTQDGVRDEDNRALRGLRAEGPAILRVGGYVLFMLPIGDPTDWPASADDAWQQLPERVYLDELTHAPGGSLSHLKLPKDNGRTRHSVVYRTAGPRDTSVRLAAGEAVGELEITSRDRSVTFSVGAEALRDGVLLGRYARCDAAAGVAEDNSMSRVHLLLVQVDDQLLAIDTASSRGTKLADSTDGDHVRIAVVEREISLVLGKRTSVRWRWVAS